MLKEIYREKWYVALLILALIASLIVPGILQNNISLEKEQITDLYESMTIKCHLVSQNEAATGFSIDVLTGNRILSTEGVGKYYVEMAVPFILVEPEQNDMIFTANGTNDLAEFASRKQFESGISGLSRNDCILNERILEEYGLEIGDEIRIMGQRSNSEINKDGNVIQLTIKGSIPSDSIYQMICSHELFFGNDNLINDEIAKVNWQHYDVFEFQIDPKYNYRFEEVRTKMKQILGSDWMIYATTKELRNVIYPLEVKVDMERTILRIIEISGYFLTAISSLLLCLSQKRSILIRKIHGEKTGSILTNVFKNVLIIEIGLLLLAIITLNMMSIISYYKLAIVCALLLSVNYITLFVVCRKNYLNLIVN